MKELGEYLKRTRISNGVSLTEACEDLEFSTSHLENIESGNVRAFKDVYELKEDIKVYAKYLGLDADKIVDEFNEYVFETTSKIPVKDIEKEIEENTKGNEEKVFSPYTRHEKKPNNVLYVLVYVLIVILAVFAVFWAVKQITVNTRVASEISYKE